MPEKSGSNSRLSDPVTRAELASSLTMVRDSIVAALDLAMKSNDSKEGQKAFREFVRADFAIANFIQDLLKDGESDG